MRMKFFSAGITMLLLSWFVFQGCHKKDQPFDAEEAKEAAFKKQIQNWWYGSFVKSGAYTKTDWNSVLAPPKNSSTKKLPRWKKANTWSVGGIQVVEMPLLYETNTIMLPGMQQLNHTAEGKRVATAAIHRLLIFQKQDGSKAVRTVTIVPSPEYAQKMDYDLSSLSMKKLPDDFSGYQMIAGWDGSKKNIIHYVAGKKPKTKKLFTTAEYNARKAVSTANAHEVCTLVWVPEYIWVCAYTPTGDDALDDQLCDEYGHWEEHDGHYEEECHEEEDPEPDPDPDDPGEGDEFADCMNSGGTFETCTCQLYGICNNDPQEQCDQAALASAEQEYYSYVAMPIDGDSYIDLPPTGVAATPIIGSGKFTVVKALSWKILADYEFKYYHREYTRTSDLHPYHAFDLFHYTTGNGYFVGSNSFISTTYATTTPTTVEVLDNDTENCRGLSHVQGTVTHKSKFKVRFPLCDPIELETTDAVDKYMTLIPK